MGDAHASALRRVRHVLASRAARRLGAVRQRRLYFSAASFRWETSARPVRENGQIHLGDARTAMLRCGRRARAIDTSVVAFAILLCAIRSTYSRASAQLASGAIGQHHQHAHIWSGIAADLLLSCSRKSAFLLQHFPMHLPPTLLEFRASGRGSRCGTMPASFSSSHGWCTGPFLMPACFCSPSPSPT